jgi:hypothetical protein
MNWGNSRSKNDPKPSFFKARRRKILKRKLRLAHQEELDTLTPFFFNVFEEQKSLSYICDSDN